MLITFYKTSKFEIEWIIALYKSDWNKDGLNGNLMEYRLGILNLNLQFRAVKTINFHWI